MDWIDYKEEMPYAYWLHNIKGVGNKGIRKLLKEALKPSRLFEMTKEQMLQTYVIKEKIFTQKAVCHIVQSREGWDVMGRYEEMKKKGIDFYPEFHPDYPEKLKEIPDAPWAVYGIGKLPEQEKMTVAVIGARECSAYGAHMAKELGRALAENGIQVVSGMARGIDSMAQQAAMEKGSAYGVLGSGVDICYPQSSRNVYENLKRNGGILSEYPPGTEPKPGNFPARNRIISGLSQAVVVVEAKEKSGTLITVDMALEQGREVYVVPGRITDALSAGCNRLMKQGADMLCSVEEFIRELHGNYGYRIGDDAAGKKVEYEKGLEDFELKILENIDFYPKSIQKIYEEAVEGEKKEEMPDLKKIMEALIRLEEKGEIQAKGGYYALKS
ncbi:MAG: DNA-protecting protein DprA [Lachnospiraceae bacterium]|nr:DNA-protecting protein DprA [Lachnospiraceae bacterium]